jgi:hypothetical protein
VGQVGLMHAATATKMPSPATTSRGAVLDVKALRDLLCACLFDRVSNRADTRLRHLEHRIAGIQLPVGVY